MRPPTEHGELNGMTLEQEQNGPKVIARLSGGNWVGLLLTAAGVLLGQAFLLNTRVVTLETTVAAHEKRLDDGDDRDQRTQENFVNSLNALRLELKK